MFALPDSTTRVGNVNGFESNPPVTVVSVLNSTGSKGTLRFDI
jgi:hypothetical protein